MTNSVAVAPRLNTAPKARQWPAEAKPTRPQYQKPSNGRSGFWYVKIGGKKVSLKTDDHSEAVRRMDILLADQVDPNQTQEICIGALVNQRLKAAEQSQTKATFRKTFQTLYDFSTGFTATFPDGENIAPGEKLHGGYGGFTVSEFKAYHAKEWLDVHKEWGPNTQKARLHCIRSVFNLAVELDQIQVSPIRKFKLKHRTTTRITYFDNETEELLYKSTSPEFAFFLWVLIKSGMRPFSEAAEATADDVRINDNNQMTINLGLRHKNGKKTGKNRVIYVTPELDKVIRAAMIERPKGSGLPLFITKQGKKWTGTNAHTQFRRLAKKIALHKRLKDKFGPDVTPPCIYSCRHTFATRMIMKVGILRTSLYMGNTPKECQRSYGHLDCLQEDLYEGMTK